MLASERTEFRGVMERIGRVFDRQVTDDLLTDYWDALRDMPLPQLRARADGYIRVGKFFPKPRDLRENPDGERRAVDTRSPEVPVDNWTATMNRILRAVLMGVCGVPDDTMQVLVAEKNRIARQMREADTTPEEWADMAPGIRDRLLTIARDARTRAGWPERRGMVELRLP